MMSFIKRKPIVLFWLSRTNIKLVMVTLTGLIIALSMLSGCLYYLDFAKQDLYLDILENEAPEHLDIDSWSENREDESLHTDIMSQAAVFGQKISQYDLEQVIRPAFLYPRSLLQERLIYQNQTLDHIISGYHGLDDSVLDDCIENSQFPLNSSEIIVYVLENNTLSPGNHINLTLLYYQQNNLKTYNFSLTVTGMMTNSSLRSDSKFRELFIGKTFQFFTSLDFFSALIQEIDLALVNDGIRGLDASIEYQYDIDLSSISRGKAVETVNNYLAFLEEIRNMRETTYLVYDTNIYYRLNSALIEFNFFFFLFLLISTPVLVLVAALVFFSLGIINEKRQRSIALLKTKGVSNSFTFIILFIETFIIALVAIIISTIIGIPVAIIMGMSSGFLTFSRNITSLDMVITPSTVQNLLILGFVFTFLTHFPSIIKLSKSEIVLLEQEASKKKKRKTGILRSNTDILLLTTGLGGIIIFNMFMDIIRGSGSPQGLMMVFMVFLTILVIISPFTFLLGCLITFNRFIPLVLYHLGNFFWNKNARLLATVSRNLNTNIKVTNRTTLLIAVSLSFMIIIASLPVSTSNYQLEKEYYKWGADININFSSLREETLEEISAALETIPGLKTTKVTLVHDICYLWTANQEYINYFLGIEDDFAEVAYWKENYNRLPLADLVSTLYSPVQNNTLIIDSKTASKDSIQLDEPYQLQISEGYDNQESISIQPVAFTNYFPGLIDRWSLLDRFYVGKYSYILEMSEKYSLSMRKYIWGQILPGYDPAVVTEQVAKSLENLGGYGGNFISVPLALEREINSLETSLLWLVVNFNFLGALAVILAAIVLFGYARMAQNIRELALGRSLGMKYHQLFFLMITEPLLLFVLSGIPGAVIGVTLLVGLIQLNAQNLFWGPPFVLEFDLTVILLAYGGILLVMILLGVVTSYKTVRTNISEILKAE